MTWARSHRIIPTQAQTMCHEERTESHDSAAVGYLQSFCTEVKTIVKRTSIEHPLSNDCLRMYVKPSIISSVDEEQDKDKRNVQIIIKPCISSSIAYVMRFISIFY
uniref:Uncharacterized protein n=1 Tax=Glossina austeni TaxID=7395 RepID=A0A1A9VTR2_GLOAU